MDPGTHHVPGRLDVCAIYSETTERKKHVRSLMLQQGRGGHHFKRHRAWVEMFSRTQRMKL